MLIHLYGVISKYKVKISSDHMYFQCDVFIMKNKGRKPKQLGTHTNVKHEKLSNELIEIE